MSTSESRPPVPCRRDAGSATAAASRWTLILLAMAVAVTLVLAGCSGTSDTLVVPAIRKYGYRGGADRS